MKLVAIPVVGNKLSPHFGHCEYFSIYQIEDDQKIITKIDLTPPPHAPGVLPQWLKENNVNTIIAGGMGQRAKNLFAQNNIDVVVGAPSKDPQIIIEEYLNQTLVLGQNQCDH